MPKNHYLLFQEGVFIGKYNPVEWSKLTAHDIFESYVYREANGCWYYSNWGSLIPLNNCDIPKDIQLLLMLIPLDQL